MTTSTPTLLDRAANFLESIQQRLKIEFDQHQQIVKNNKQDTGARATLKRALTEDPKHLRDTYSIVLEYLYQVGIPYNPDNEYDKGKFWLLVACQFAHYPQPISRDRKRNFGYSCWLLQQEIRRSSPEAKGVERRFHALLDTSLKDLRSPLLALAQQIKSKDAEIKAANKLVSTINYAQLITDLHAWDHPKQFVQDNWARAFWGVPPKPPEESEALAEDQAE